MSGAPMPETWWQTAELWWWVVFTAVAGVVLCVASFLIVRDEIALDVHHAVAAGRVTEVSTGKGPGAARVSFPAAGEQREATVQQPYFGRALEPGDRTRVEYLRSDPAVARRAGAHDLIGYAVVLGCLALLVLGSLSVSPAPKTPPAQPPTLRSGAPRTCRSSTSTASTSLRPAAGRPQPAGTDTSATSRG